MNYKIPNGKRRVTYNLDSKLLDRLETLRYRYRIKNSTEALERALDYGVRHMPRPGKEEEAGDA